jgi:glycosyltransferase involved in cell wall biosynthesis
MPDASLSVLLETEGTYPYAGGGVSTWCHTLCDQLRDVDFTLLAVTGQPASASRYPLPPNVRQVHPLPLWGHSEPSVASRPGVPFSTVYRSRLRTPPAVVAEEFLPPFEQVLRTLIHPEHTTRADGRALHRLHRFFQTYDYKQAFRDQGTWDCFERIVLAEADRLGDAPTLVDAATCLRWLYHFFLPLDSPLPRTDLTHTTAAGTCGLASIVAHWEHGTPMLVTDHGVYLRERYLAVSETPLPFVQKWFLTRLSQYISRLCYATAAVVAPVCNYNRRWEERLGTDPAKIRTIYNGISTDDFQPAPKPAATADRPTVVAAAHVYPLKDIETMIRSCAVARQSVPDVQYRVYGALDVNPEYVTRCRTLISQLDLTDHVLLQGFHDTPTRLYHEGDLSILSSISEGFPYAVLESMACERPVVATDVGGVSEAVGDGGLVVPPRDATALGTGVATLLTDADRRLDMARRARRRVLDTFRLDDAMARYRALYDELASAESPERAVRPTALHGSARLAAPLSPSHSSSITLDESLPRSSY